MSAVEEATYRAEQAILRTLKNYPNITRSMLSVHLRPTYKNWTDALKELIERGEVIQETVVRDTNRAVVIYHLPEY